MSRRKTLAEHLLPLPAEIHRDMLENRESLVPGAAASIIGDTEETVRKHYGCDSGQAAAAEVRKALLAHHPDIFKKMKRKHSQ